MHLELLLVQKNNVQNIQKRHDNVRNINSKQPAIIISNVKVDYRFAADYHFRMDNSLNIFLQNSYISKSQEWLKKADCKYRSTDKGNLICTMCHDWTPHSSCHPLHCAVEISDESFTTVWQTAPTKILSGHDQRLKTLLNQTAHKLFQYVTHISRNNTPLCVILSQSSYSIINKTANLFESHSFMSSQWPGSYLLR